jgi:hypothetical protein
MCILTGAGERTKELKKGPRRGFLSVLGSATPKAKSYITQSNRANNQRARSGFITYTIACGGNDG